MKSVTYENEGEEALVSEQTKQVSSSFSRDWGWVDREVWTERMLAALENGVRGGKWFSLIDKVYDLRTLQRAWADVQARDGAAGVDGQSCAQFAANAERYLAELSEALRAGSYRPAPVRRVEIPKAGGKHRPLGIPTVKDRIVQSAVKRVIEPIFEREFCSMSYGFRPGRGCKDALREVDVLLKEGYTFVVDADLKQYFDSIPHERLMASVERRISDGRLLDLLRSWLKQDVVREMEKWTPAGGTPQGAVISPLLANLYLHDLDVQMVRQGYHMVRYADDFVILCKDARQAQAALAEVTAWVDANGLSLNPDKTHVGNCLETGQGFEFLGYRFESGRRWARRKSRQRLKDKIRSHTRRTGGQSLARVIARLNPILKGWYGYFQHANRREFPEIDGFVRRRLRALLRKQAKRPGMGHNLADHRLWSNAFFAEYGLFTMTAAHALASQSR